MAYSFINHVEAALGVNGGTTGSIDTSGANLLVIALSWYHSGTEPTVSDSKSNTWSGLLKSNTAFTASKIYYCQGGTVGSGHTFTASGTGSYSSMCVLAFSGAAVTPFDQQNGATATADVTLATGSITPTENDEVVIAALSHENNSSGAVSIDGGFTAYKQAYSAGAGEGCGIAYLIQTTATAANPTWNITNSSHLSARIASFKAAAATAKAPPPFLNRTWRRWPLRAK